MSELQLPLLEIRNISIKHDIGEIKKIKLDGNKDIFNHPKVRDEIAADGKIISIQGVMTYKNEDYDFDIGHTLGTFTPLMAHIKVTKKGDMGDEDRILELHSMLLEIYEEIFLENAS